MKEKETSRLSVFLVVLAVCLVYALGGGIRSNYGLMRGAMAASSGVDYAGISFVLAAAQLAFGIMQPVFGAVALKTSNVFVLLCGVAFLFHQVGSFVSAWIGGLAVTATGGYTLIWCINAALCVAAAVFAFRTVPRHPAGQAKGKTRPEQGVSFPFSVVCPLPQL